MTCKVRQALDRALRDAKIERLQESEDQKRHLWDSIPRGEDPIGLAGRRLNRSAKVSSVVRLKQMGI